MLSEFRQFLLRGNAVDLAVAVVMGAAFTAIFNSLINDLVMPLVGLLVGGIDFTQLSPTAGSAIVAQATFLQAIVNFLVIGTLLFPVVRAVTRRHKKQQTARAEPPPEERLSTEIRDLVKEGRGRLLDLRSQRTPSGLWKEVK